MGQLVYLKNHCCMQYPVGEYFSDTNFEYIRETARIIHRTFPYPDKLVLVVRGHSGSILAGGIAYLLKRKGREVIISVSRKSESSHGENLEGIYSTLSKDTRTIIVDDFVESGLTIKTIIEDISTKIKECHFDMLCVANYWSDESLIKAGVREADYREIISHFDCICCNKPFKD